MGSSEKVVCVLVPEPPPSFGDGVADDRSLSTIPSMIACRASLLSASAIDASLVENEASFSLKTTAAAY